MTSARTSTLPLAGSPPAARVRRSGLGWIDRLTLGGIGLVVVLVSIPRVRAFAMHSNQADARALLPTLGELVGGEPGASLARAGAGAGTLARRLQDARWLAAAGALRHHGYLFRSVRSPGGGARLAAWPWHAGRTGSLAFALDEDGVVWTHSNAEGRWSGPERPPEALERELGAGGWKRVAGR